MYVQSEGMDCFIYSKFPFPLFVPDVCTLARLGLVWSLVLPEELPAGTIINVYIMYFALGTVTAPDCADFF
jgi:hypothetical protein